MAEVSSETAPWISPWSRVDEGAQVVGPGPGLLESYRLVRLDERPGVITVLKVALCALHVRIGVIGQGCGAHPRAGEQKSGCSRHHPPSLEKRRGVNQPGGNAEGAQRHPIVGGQGQAQCESRNQSPEVRPVVDAGRQQSVGKADRRQDRDPEQVAPGHAAEGATLYHEVGGEGSQDAEYGPAGPGPDGYRIKNVAGDASEQSRQYIYDEKPDMAEGPLNYLPENQQR